MSDKVVVLALTKDESEKLNAFLGVCVRKNVGFSLRGNRVGYTAPVGIQEVYNASEQDIVTYGEFLFKASQNNGSPFAKDKKAFLVDGKISGNEVIDNLQLILQEKRYFRQQEENAKEIAAIEKQLEGMKSEDEIKSDLKQKLAALKGEVAQEQLTVETPAV